MDLTLIFLIVDIVLIFILVVALLSGFAKGFKKSLVHFIASMVGAILLLIFLDPICSLLINTELPLHMLGQEDMSIKQFIMSTVEGLNGGVPIEEGGALAEFADGVMIMSLRILVLYVGLLINGIVSLILRVIITIFIGSDRGKYGEKKKKVFSLRFAGMAINGARCLFFMGLFILPLYGIISVGAGIKESVDYEVSENDKNTTDYLFELIDVAENSYVKKGINLNNKVLNKNIDTDFLGYLTRIKTEYGTLDWVNEAELFQLLVKFLDANNSTNEGKVDVMNFVVDNQQLFIDFLKNSDIIPIIMPPMLEMISGEGYEKLGLSKEEVLAIDWDKETTELSEILSALASFIDVTGVDFEQFNNWFDSEEAIEAFGKVGDELKDSQLFKLLLTTINDLLKEELFNDDKYKNLANLLDFSKLAGDDLDDDFKRIGTIIQALNKMGFFEENMAADGENLSTVIINVFQLSIVKGNETTILTELFEVTGVNEMLHELDIKLNFENIDWSTETTAVAGIVKNFMALNTKVSEFDQDTLFKIASDENRDNLITFVSSLFDSKLLSQVIVSLLNNAFKSAGLEEFLDPAFDGYLDGTTSVNGLKNDVEILVDILVMMTDENGNIVNLNFEQAGAGQIDLIFDILELANQTTIFNLNSVIGYLSDMLASTGFNDSNGEPIEVSKNSLTKEEWTNELAVLKKVINAMMELDDLSTVDFAEKETTLVTLMDALKDSILLADLEKTLLQNLVDNLGYDFDISTIDLSNVTWANEIDILLETLNSYEEASNDITTLDNIKDLMLKASGSVIATAIVGTMINEQIATVYPELSEGLIPERYDFTDAQVLLDNADKVDAIVKFGEALKELIGAIESTNVTDEIIDNFADKYAALSSGDPLNRPDLTDELMGAVIAYAINSDTSVTADEMALVNYQAEASTISDALKIIYDANSSTQNKLDATLQLKTTVLGTIIAQYMS